MHCLPLRPLDRNCRYRCVCCARKSSRHSCYQCNDQFLEAAASFALIQSLQLVRRPQDHSGHGNSNEVISCRIIRFQAHGRQNRPRSTDHATSSCGSVGAKCHWIYVQLCTWRPRARIWRWLQTRSHHSLGLTGAAGAHLRKSNSGPAPTTGAGTHHKRSGIAARAPVNAAPRDTRPWPSRRGPRLSSPRRPMP